MNPHVAVVALFGDFLLDRSAGGLFRIDEHSNRVPLPLGSRALDVLSVLVERHGELVSKQTIMDAVWSDTVVHHSRLAATTGLAGCRADRVTSGP